jgi:hypothetical protein
MKRTVLVLAALLWASVAAAEGPDEVGRLLSIIAQDSSYKVRMQAIRVLGKRLAESTTPVAMSTIEGLGRSALGDESELVRGFACAALGNLQDARVRSVLEKALKDKEAFVREQATSALSRVPTDAPPTPPPPPPTGPSGPNSGLPRLVVGIDQVPGVDAKAFESSLLAMMKEGFSAQAGARYQVGDPGAGKGYHLKGSIAELSAAAQPDGSQKVTIVVKIAIATWPENNLRHVMSAKASAQTKASGGALAKVQEKLLRAAVDRAVKDSMAEIGGG